LPGLQVPVPLPQPRPHRGSNIEPQIGSVRPRRAADPQKHRPSLTVASCELARLRCTHPLTVSQHDDVKALDNRPDSLRPVIANYELHNPAEWNIEVKARSKAECWWRHNSKKGTLPNGFTCQCQCKRCRTHPMYSQRASTLHSARWDHRCKRRIDRQRAFVCQRGRCRNRLSHCFKIWYRSKRPYSHYPSIEHMFDYCNLAGKPIWLVLYL